MSDVLDGFFPYELKEQFPNGVLFDLVDRRQGRGTHRQGGQYACLDS